MNFKFYNSKNLVVFIAIMIVIAHILTKLLGPFLEELISGKFKEEVESIADYLGVFGTLGIVTIFLIAVDKWLWRYRLFNWLVDIPNLNGRYKGKLNSDFNGGITKDVVIEIVQSASNLKVCGYFADINNQNSSSSSFSLSETIIKGPDNFFTLFYIYSNSPSINSSQIYQHGGTVYLKYHPDNKKLIGEYYNHRKNAGHIELTFDNEKLLGRF